MRNSPLRLGPAFFPHSANNLSNFFTPPRMNLLLCESFSENRLSSWPRRGRASAPPPSSRLDPRPAPSPLPLSEFPFSPSSIFWNQEVVFFPFPFFDRVHLAGLSGFSWLSFPFFCVLARHCRALVPSSPPPQGPPSLPILIFFSVRPP